MKQYVIYYRQWSKKSRSRVELAAQEAEAKRFVAFNAGRILASFVEKEDLQSGVPSSGWSWPKPSKQANRSEAVLVIAHLGRLVKKRRRHAGLAEQQC